MTYLVAFIILTRCLLVQGILEWKVVKTITDYGQNVTLFCNVSNCCPQFAGWNKYTPNEKIILIDVKTWTPTKKYDGKVLKDGYTLVIQNLTNEDLNVSYSCVYGSIFGDQQTLLEENVFNYISTTQQYSQIDDRTFDAGNLSTTQRNGQIDNQTFSIGKIAGIILGVFAAVSVGLFIVCFLKRMKKRHKHIRTSTEDSNEVLPLIDYFLEDPHDIECIEGEDAMFSCEVWPKSSSVKWFKDGNEIKPSVNCIMSTVDTHYELKLRNTIPRDSGKYCVQVGKFSRKMHLKVKHVIGLYSLMSFGSVIFLFLISLIFWNDTSMFIVIIFPLNLMGISKVYFDFFSRSVVPNKAT